MASLNVASAIGIAASARIKPRWPGDSPAPGSRRRRVIRRELGTALGERRGADHGRGPGVFRAHPERQRDDARQGQLVETPARAAKSSWEDGLSWGSLGQKACRRRTAVN
jgi:hypothetical protein